MALEKQYRLRDAAEFLSLRESTLRKWVLLRRVRVNKIGGAVRIPESELARLIGQNVVPARPERPE